MKISWYLFAVQVVVPVLAHLGAVFIVFFQLYSLLNILSKSPAWSRPKLEVLLPFKITGFDISCLQKNTDKVFHDYDHNVLPVWQKGITGKGVVVTILDDGKHKDYQFVNSPCIVHTK